MSTPARGLDADLYLGGTLIALLTGVDFSWEKAVTEFSAMGTTKTTDVLQGVRRYSGAYRKAYVDNTYIDVFVNESVLTGSLVPRSGQTIVGSLVITGGSLSNMETEESAAVIEEGTFVMYSMTFS